MELWLFQAIFEVEMNVVDELNIRNSQKSLCGEPKILGLGYQVNYKYNPKLLLKNF